MRLRWSVSHGPHCSLYDRVNVPAFIGAGAVSVNVLSVVVFCPKSASFLPEAAIQAQLPSLADMPVQRLRSEPCAWGVIRPARRRWVATRPGRPSTTNHGQEERVCYLHRESFSL